MKEKYTPLLLLVSFCCCSGLLAQVSNGDTYNYQVNFTQGFWGSNSESGDEEPTIFLRAADDTNYAATSLFSFAYNSSTDYAICYNWDDTAPTWGPVTDQNLVTKTNSTTGAFDLTMASFEDDTGSRCYLDDLAFDTDDDAYSNSFLHYVSSYNRSVWNENIDFSISGNDSKARTKLTWRYANGRNGNELHFGSLASGVGLSHTNANRSAPEDADENMGYFNDWSSEFDSRYRDSPEVVYEFTLYTSMQVTISTNYGTTNFDTYIHLLQLPTATTWNYVDSNDDVTSNNTKSTLQKYLCPGNYRVIVEGFSPSSVGDFLLYIYGTNVAVTAGSISQPTASQCDYVMLPAINNLSLASSNVGGISYNWEKSLNNGAWTTIAGATSSSLPNPGTMNASTSLRFRRRATDCGTSNYSNIVTFTPYFLYGDPGTIGISGSNTVPYPQELEHSTLTSVSDAVAIPNPSTIFWEKRFPNGTWTTIPGATAQTYLLPELSTTTEFRRGITSFCGITDNSNVITVTVVIPNGIVQGKVLSGTSSGVIGVTVCAVRTNALPGSLAGKQYCATTVSGGSYEITDIYYGTNSLGEDFTIIPSKTGASGLVHDFTPPSIPKNLKPNSPVKPDVDFIDNTSYSIIGRIVQQDGATTCPAVGVELLINGQYLGNITDDNGDYALSVDDPGSYTIKPRFDNHTFSLVQQVLMVDDNKSNIDFTDTQKRTISGYLRADCDIYIGQSILEIFDETNCFVKNVVTNAGSGFYSIELPARNYTVRVSDYTPSTGLPKDAVINFFAAIPVDLTSADQTLDFIYHQPPIVRILGFPDLLCGGYDKTVVEQTVSYSITIEVWQVVDVCPVADGTIIINDQIGDNGAAPVTLDIVNGKATYTLIPGLPNIIDPYLKTFSVEATDGFARTAMKNVQALVTGARAREQTFATVSPEVPLLILRDPPGDGSSSFFEQSTTFETATSFYALDGLNVNTWANVRVGTEFEAGLGVSTETEIWGDLGGNLEVNGTNTTATETVLSITNTQVFSTSDNDDITGAEGDVFMGAALNLLYAVADEINFDAENCVVVPSKSLIVGNDGFATTYIYTEDHILNTLIPQLILLRDLSTGAANRDYENQISVWEQTVQRNNELKENASFDKNISFSAAAPYSSTTTASSSSTSTIEFAMEMNAGVAVELGFEIGGSGISGGVETMVKMETGSSTSTTVLSEMTTGYTLSDDDQGDFFSVDIKKDPVYKTPVFKLVAGTSSCPAEPGTQPRDDLRLTADDPIQSNIPAAGEAEFILKLGNTSQSEETRTYSLRFIQGSNPDGAMVTIGGSPYISPIPYTIGFLGETQVTVKVKRGASNVYSYEGLQFELSSECDPDINTIISLSAFFDSPCSPITLAEPASGWVANQQSNNIVTLKLTDYNVNNLDQVLVQYGKVGENNWTTAQVLNSGDFVNAVTYVDWNITNVPDGAYEIRLRLKCGLNSVYSLRSTGTIDRKSPEVLGVPEPVDDNFVAGDEISISFTELLQCSNFVNSDVSIKRLTDNQVFTGQISCFNNKVYINPDFNFQAQEGFPFEVTLQNVKDAHGNSVSQPITWEFTVNGVLGALPLNFLRFDGKALAVGNLLQWRTANEQNTEAHLIERSEDGKYFIPIGKIAAAGNSNQTLAYEWLDEQPLQSAYYRIRTVDSDGQEHISITIFLARAGEEKFIFVNLFPVPADEAVTLEFLVPIDEQVQVQVFDLTGRTILQQHSNAIAGSNQLKIDTQQFPTGTYLVRLIRSNGTYEVKKMIIQEYR